MYLNNIILILRISTRYLMSLERKYIPSLSMFLSCIGLIISIATLISVMSVMNGFKDEFMTMTMGANAHISVYATNGATIKNSELISEELRKLSGVKSVDMVIETQGMLLRNGHVSGIVIRAMNEQCYNAKIKRLLPDLKDNTLATKLKPEYVVIGNILATRLNLKIGDRVGIIGARESAFDGIIPHKSIYNVGGIIKTGIQQYDSSLLFMHIQDAKIFTDFHDANILEIMLENIDQLNLVMNNINLNPRWMNDIVAYSWQDHNADILRAMDLESSTMLFILTLFIIISISLVFISFTMLVNNKKKSIAIMRSMGMSIRMVSLIFLFSGFIIIFLAMILGTGLGVLLVHNIQSIEHILAFIGNDKLFLGLRYFLAHLPTKIMISDIIYTNTICLVAGSIAIVWPAIYAARSNIIETLKQE